MSREPIIRIHDLGVRYDSTIALEHVDLEIYADDFVGIIGPNGGGKSTLVKAIMGIVPHSGSIEYSDKLLRGKKPHIGYLPQISSFDFRPSAAYGSGMGQVTVSVWTRPLSVHRLPSFAIVPSASFRAASFSA